MRRIFCILLFLLFALTAGCGVTASVSTSDLTRPVMLGKIRKLHGTDSDQWQRMVPFDIDITRRNWREKAYAGGKANSELLKLIESYDGRIAVDHVYFGSYSILVVGLHSGSEEEASWVDINGGFYRVQAAEHGKK